MGNLQQEKGIFHWGQFALDPVRRSLLRDGARIKLAERLLDVLLFLVANHGRVVERDELLQQVWAGRTVEDNNVSQAIFELRKVLKTEGVEHSIVTVPGRGFRFAEAGAVRAGSACRYRGRAAVTGGAACRSLDDRPDTVMAAVTPLSGSPWWRSVVAGASMAFLGWADAEREPVARRGAVCAACPLSGRARFRQSQRRSGADLFLPTACPSS